MNFQALNPELKEDSSDFVSSNISSEVISPQKEYQNFDDMVPEQSLARVNESP